MRKAITILLALALVLTSASAATKKENTASRDKLNKEIALLQEQLRDVNAQSNDATAKLTLLRKQISARKALVAESDRELNEIDGQIAAKEIDVAQLRAHMDTVQQQYNRLIKIAYKNRDIRVWYMYVLSSNSLAQATRRYTYLKNLSRQMSGQILQMRDLAEEMQARMEELETMRQEAAEVRNSRQAELNEVKADEAEAKKLVNELNKEKKKYQQQIETRRQQVKALEDQIRKAIEAERAAAAKKAAEEAAKKSGKSTASGQGATITTTKKPVDDPPITGKDAEIEKSKGKLPWPVEGVVVESFGQHYHPVYKNVKLPFNNGVNIGTKAGAQVKCVYPGEVKQVIVMPGYNQCVLVQHGGYYTFYCKLGSVSVKAGDKVKTGQVLGTVDTIEGKNQLHFQLWAGRNPQDPEQWLKR